MRKGLGRLVGKLALAAGLGLSIAGVSLATPDPVYVRQGNAWTAAARADFYSRDQGSRIIPLAWLRALTAADGQPFLHDGLARYGYLPNPNGRFNLPVGFMAAAGPAGVQYAAMNCSACHTRQIAVGGTEYRIDGGPALTDFQAFLSDLDAAVGRVLADDTAFAAFAAAMPGAGPDLKGQVAAWYRREHVLISRALPTDNPWGLGRLDAVSMIFNRLTAMDLGPPPSYMIDRERPARDRSGSLSLPLECTAAGPTPVAGLLPEWQRSPRAHPQSRPGLWRLRRLPPAPAGQSCRFPDRQFDPVDRAGPARDPGEDDRSAAMALARRP